MENVQEILESLSKDLNKYEDVSLEGLANQTNVDGRFEERMVRFISNTLPRELKILRIDAIKEDWIAFENTLVNINKKLNLIGAEELQSKGNTLVKNYVLYHNFGRLAEKVIEFDDRINKLLLNIKDLFYIEE